MARKLVLEGEDAGRSADLKFGVGGIVPFVDQLSSVEGALEGAASSAIDRIQIP